MKHIFDNFIERYFIKIYKLYPVYYISAPQLFEAVLLK